MTCTWLTWTCAPPPPPHKPGVVCLLVTPAPIVTSPATRHRQQWTPVCVRVRGVLCVCVGCVWGVCVCVGGVCVWVVCVCTWVVCWGVCVWVGKLWSLKVNWPIIYKPCSRLSKLSVALDKSPNLSVRESSHYLSDHSLFHGNGCGNGWGFVSSPCRRRCFPTSLNNRLCISSSTVFAVILHNVQVRTLSFCSGTCIIMHNEYLNYLTIIIYIVEADRHKTLPY